MIEKLLKILFPKRNEANLGNELDECINPWRKYRDDLISQKLNLEKQIDKTVFTICSGAIGISLIVLDKLAPSKEYSYLFCIIGLGWICLVISLIYQTFSFVSTSKMLKESIGNVEKIINCQSLLEVIEEENNYYSKWYTQNKKIDKRNNYAFVFMIAGIFFILSFSFYSLLLRDNKSSQQINIILSDSLNYKINYMSKETKGKGSSNSVPSKNDSNQAKSIKTVKEGKLTVRQAEQIQAPPIRTRPKSK